ncbi:MAG: nuclear transport factor 2 family protein [Planctomycetia bacterium]|nr:nuclear transport factor 2 family protein [Planctomycetia bacterium]
MKRLLLLFGILTVLAVVSQMTADDSPARKSAEAEIRSQAVAFCKAFNQGNASAVAAFYSDGCEYTSETGRKLVGRSAIEAAYTEHFKTNPGETISVDITSIRFPSTSMAIEEGTIETRFAQETALPNCSHYRAVHVLENGKWLTALSQEWGVSQDKIKDLSWLIGQWDATTKQGVIQLQFEWNEKKNTILTRFTMKNGDKVLASGNGRIHQNGRGLVGNSYQDNGKHGESIWYRDGNRWIAEDSETGPDGAASRSVNILTRLNDNSLLWRTVERTINGEPAPDEVPVKLTRSK